LDEFSAYLDLFYQLVKVQYESNKELEYYLFDKYDSINLYELSYVMDDLYLKTYEILNVFRSFIEGLLTKKYYLDFI
jgi:hypothetical protein